MTTRAKQLMSVGILMTVMLASCSAPNAQEAASSTSAGSSSSPSSTRTPAQQATPSPSGNSGAEESPSPSRSQEPSLRQQAEALADELSASEQAASLVMAGVPATGATAAEISAMKKQGISNVFLRGRSQLPVKQTAAQVQEITQGLESGIPGQLPVWVATDQEGGFVRVLQGPGFTELPTALTQGGWPVSKLEREVGAAGKELAEAGINVNLAPVADVVPASIGTGNAPIGYFGREYAHDAAGVSKAISTVNEALRSEGVQPVVKHFPGLGRVAGNTDTSTKVTDTKIDADSSDLQPFEQAIEQGKSWVMVSNARYSRLDGKNDAPFSSKIITGLLREQMGYGGIVISDDLCEAKQVGYLPVGERAVKFVAAGGTVPLCVKSAPAITMAKALAAEAKADGKFAAQVREAAVLVLEEKLRMQ